MMSKYQDVDPRTGFNLVQLREGQGSPQSESSGPLVCKQKTTVRFCRHYIKLTFLNGLAILADKSGTA